MRGFRNHGNQRFQYRNCEDARELPLDELYVHDDFDVEVSLFSKEHRFGICDLDYDISDKTIASGVFYSHQIDYRRGRPILPVNIIFRNIKPDSDFIGSAQICESGLLHPFVLEIEIYDPSGEVQEKIYKSLQNCNIYNRSFIILRFLETSWINKLDCNNKYKSITIDKINKINRDLGELDTIYFKSIVFQEHIYTETPRSIRWLWLYSYFSGTHPAHSEADYDREKPIYPFVSLEESWQIEDRKIRPHLYPNSNPLKHTIDLIFHRLFGS